MDCDWIIDREHKKIIKTIISEFYLVQASRNTDENTFSAWFDDLEKVTKAESGEEEYLKELNAWR